VPGRRLISTTGSSTTLTGPGRRNGGQYVSDDYVSLLEGANVRISMCDQVYENAHIERVNGTIKNQYLVHRHITTFDQLVKELDRTISTYNTLRPHSALGNLTPCAFEQHIK